ncbi:hypothetical protein [Fictibacillus barbaricus]|uniref:Uncharacterized protein n=1 Tax=Fictibacillus barbaricus TaxID=182136 RepID=A0ABS2ZB73_9BACL|nr:hypothetical protein [Fictibacillus barbaricus]MBN3545453.1 hypothetical protein [Fictibacillus barbaricus]GGB53523.1 hypothetical protein GCM10007199_18990 [Fictibacillus barbaricus]
MKHKKNDRINTVSHDNPNTRQNKEEILYVTFQDMELDTNVNEDPIREGLLDESMDSFLESKGKQ